MLMTFCYGTGKLLHECERELTCVFKQSDTKKIS